MEGIKKAVLREEMYPYFREFKIYEFLNPEDKSYITIEILEPEFYGRETFKVGDSVIATKNEEGEWKYSTVVTSSDYSYEWEVTESTLLVLLAYTHATEEERKMGWSTVAEIPKRLRDLLSKRALKPIISGSRCPIC